MALFIPGITTCSLCDEPVAESDDRLATMHFIADETHPLYAYSDSVMHRRCFSRWRHRFAFVAEWLRVVHDHPRWVYRLRFLYLWAVVLWWCLTAHHTRL
jgi:hypothetical protein